MLEDKNQSRTSLSQLGEFGLIEHLTKNFTVSQKSTLKSIGDDAAVLNFGDKKAVISTDLLVEGVHFDLAYMPLKHLGYKAVVANVSDICAMNATPTQITVSVAVSNESRSNGTQVLHFQELERPMRNTKFEWNRHEFLWHLTFWFILLLSILMMLAGDY